MLRLRVRAQITDTLEALEGDEGFRAEYEGQWSRQRTYPVWQYLHEAQEQAHAAAHAGDPAKQARFSLGGMLWAGPGPGCLGRGPQQASAPFLVGPCSMWLVRGPLQAVTLVS